MIYRTLLLFSISVFLFSCEGAIKNNTDKVIVEKGTEVINDSTYSPPIEFKPNKVIDSTEKLDSAIQIEPAKNLSEEILKDCIGYWVGYFEKDLKEDWDQDLDVYADEGFYWARRNKINISIDKIVGNQVIGHSVVAGNDRPFNGTIKIDSTNNLFSYNFELKEPGDNVYDGKFSFVIYKTELSGKWKAYKKIEIPRRKYKLERKEFQYNPEISLDRNNKKFLNWEKFISEEEKSSEDIPEEYEDEYGIRKEFASTTDSVYSINASLKLLTKKDVENLKKGDLKVIRNTIYARHGYSFKNRQLRVFFDAQPWYIPVHSDIKKELTEIEKKNIRLLLKYEKNAVEYYDFFGRG